MCYNLEMNLHSFVLIQATDLDLGTNGLVTYSIKDASESPANTPFSLSSDDGIVTTKRDLSAELNKPVQYRFRAVASDNPVRFTEKQSDETNVIVSIFTHIMEWIFVVFCAFNNSHLDTCTKCDQMAFSDKFDSSI